MGYSTAFGGIKSPLGRRAWWSSVVGEGGDVLVLVEQGSGRSTHRRSQRSRRRFFPEPLMVVGGTVPERQTYVPLGGGLVGKAKGK